MMAEASLGPSAQPSMSWNVQTDPKLVVASDTFSHHSPYVEDGNSQCARNQSGTMKPNNPQNDDGCKVERKQAVERDQSAMTIEFLRARLLSERATSKAAREEAQRNARRVLELQRQLQLEIEERKKAEAAAEEAFAKLRHKDLSKASVNSGAEENGSSCEDIKESLRGSEREDLCRDAASKLIQPEIESSVTLFVDAEKDNMTFQTILSSDERTSWQGQNRVCGPGFCVNQEPPEKAHTQSNEDQLSAQQADDFNRNVDGAVESNGNTERLRQEMELNEELVGTEISTETVSTQTSNLAKKIRSLIEQQIRGMETQLEEEITGLPEGQSQVQLVKLKLQGLLDDLATLLEEKLLEDPNNNKLLRTSSIPKYQDSPMHEGEKGMCSANEVQRTDVSESPCKSENSTTQEVRETNDSSNAGTVHDKAFREQKEKSDDATSVSMLSVTPPLNSAEILQGPFPPKLWKAHRRLYETSHFPDGNEALKKKETVNREFDIFPSVSDEKLVMKDRASLIKPEQIAPVCRVEKTECFEPNMRTQSDLLNPEVGQVRIHRIHDGKLAGNTGTGHRRAEWLHSCAEQVSQKQWTANGSSFSKSHDQIVSDELASHVNERTGSNGSSYVRDSFLGDLPLKSEIESVEEYATIPGRERILPTGSSTLPYRSMELAIIPDAQKGEYPFSPKVDGNIRKHFQNIALSKNSQRSQTSKVFKDERSGRVESVLAALRVAKQHIRNSMDQEDFLALNVSLLTGVSEDGYSGSAYYVSSPTGMESPLGYPAVESQQISPSGHPILESQQISDADCKLTPYAPDWQSTHGLSMQSPTLATAPTLIGQHNILRRSRSTFDTFSMPPCGTYHKPRRKVHLGNGISLYTD